MLMTVTFYHRNRKDKIYDKAKEIMKSRNLLVNEEKTEYTAVKRGSKEEERAWRNVIKLG